MSPWLELQGNKKKDCPQLAPEKARPVWCSIAPHPTTTSKSELSSCRPPSCMQPTRGLFAVPGLPCISTALIALATVAAGVSKLNLPSLVIISCPCLGMGAGFMAQYSLQCQRSPWYCVVGEPAARWGGERGPPTHPCT